MGIFSEFKTEVNVPVVNKLNVNINSKSVKAELSAFSFIDKDSKQYVYYIPSLEISGYGETKEKSQEMVKFSMDELFKHLTHLSYEELTAELKSLGWRRDILFKKQFSTSYVDADGALKNFNVEEDSVERLTLTAA